MTTITAKFQGKTENLKDALATGIRYESKRRIKGNELTVTFICENEDYETALRDVQDCIDLSQIDRCECDLVSIG